MASRRSTSPCARLDALGDADRLLHAHERRLALEHLGGQTIRTVGGAAQVGLEPEGLGHQIARRNFKHANLADRLRLALGAVQRQAQPNAVGRLIRRRVNLRQFNRHGLRLLDHQALRPQRQRPQEFLPGVPRFAGHHRLCVRQLAPCFTGLVDSQQSGRVCQQLIGLAKQLARAQLGAPAQSLDRARKSLNVGLIACRERPIRRGPLRIQRQNSKYPRNNGSSKHGSYSPTRLCLAGRM